MRPRKKILIVDANEERAGLLRCVLEVRGFAVRAEQTAEAAAQRTRDWDPDLAVFGWPQTGIDVRAAIRGVTAATARGGSLLTLALAGRRTGGEDEDPVTGCTHALHGAPMDCVIETVRRFTISKRGPKPEPKPVAFATATAHVVGVLSAEERKLA